MSAHSTRLATIAQRSGPTRERLLRAGVELFQANGFHGTGVAAILARAQAHKGCFYHHFPGGKEELAVVAVRWLADEVNRYLDHLLAKGADGNALALGLAKYAAAGLRRRNQMRGSLIGVLAAEAVPASKPITDALVAACECWIARLARGFRGDEASAAQQARIALALVEGATVQARIAGQPSLVVSIVGAACCK
jgi:TetR/AcrR family transcriptional repressor of lmrAB and yxaGH operons